MLENEFHKLEEKQEIRTTISQIRKEIKKQDSKKAFLELLQGKESMIVAFFIRGRCKDKEKYSTSDRGFKA